jgi:hypothetical protein
MKKHSLAGLCLAILVLAAVVPNAGAGPQTDQTIKKVPIDPNTGILLLKPDLVIRKIWFAKWVENPNVSPLVPITTSLKQGVKVWMVCDLVNDSSRNLKGLWTLGFYIDGEMKWNNSWGDLDAGKPLRGLGPYTPAGEGSHNYRCTLDVYKQIAESHEDNNNKEVLFMVVK